MKVILISLLMLFSIHSFAQTKDDAVNAYNKAVTLASNDLSEAVKAMIESAEIAEKVGAEADTIGQMAEQQIATLQFNYATSLYKEKKMDEAIDNFMLANEYAKKYNDDATRAKSADLLPKLYLAKGVGEYKESKFDAAVESYSKAIEYDSTMARAWLNMGLAYKKMDKSDEQQNAMENAIEVGLANNDEKTVDAARKTLSEDLLIDANNAFKKNDFNQAASKLDKALQYADNNPEIYYLYAVTLNKLSKFDEAQAQAEKGLAIESDDAAKKARFHFEIGNALAGKGENGNACASYKKAAVGQFAESANYQINNVLKCN